MTIPHFGAGGADGGGCDCADGAGCEHDDVKNAAKKTTGALM